MDFERGGRGLLDVLSWNLPEGTKENQERLQSRPILEMNTSKQPADKPDCSVAHFHCTVNVYNEVTYHAAGGAC
jgi:hypothetical protein